MKRIGFALDCFYELSRSSTLPLVSVLFTGCLISDGSLPRHRITRAIVGVVDDTHVVYSESRVEEPCGAECLAGRDGRRREAFYVLTAPDSASASSQSARLLAEDSLPPAARFIHPYLYLDSPDPDSVIRIDPLGKERRAVARPFGLFRKTITDVFLSSGGKYTVVHGCAGISCAISLYETATGTLFRTLPVGQRTLALEEDGLVLSGRDESHASGDSGHIPVFQYHAATGIEAGSLLAGKVLGTVHLFNGSAFFLYRNGGPARMFPEIGDSAFRDRLELLAALDAFPYLNINPVTGAYFQERNGNLVGGNFYSGTSATLLDLADID